MEEGEYGESETATCLFELFTGLKDIHSRSITHRDLKLENLIFAEKDNLSSLRIADFGLAKKMKTARGKLVEQCGTPAYVAPEVRPRVIYSHSHHLTSLHITCASAALTRFFSFSFSFCPFPSFHQQLHRPLTVKTASL